MSYYYYYYTVRDHIVEPMLVVEGRVASGPNEGISCSPEAGEKNLQIFHSMPVIFSIEWRTRHLIKVRHIVGGPRWFRVSISLSRHARRL